MKSSSVNLQDSFLNNARREELLVIVHLTNGLKLEGTVKGFDNFTLVLNDNGREHLIYKHAVSTVTPLETKTIVSHKEMSCPKKEELEALAEKYNKKTS